MILLWETLSDSNFCKPYNALGNDINLLCDRSSVTNCDSEHSARGSVVSLLCAKLTQTKFCDKAIDWGIDVSLLTDILMFVRDGIMNISSGIVVSSLFSRYAVLNELSNMMDLGIFRNIVFAFVIHPYVLKGGMNICFDPL